MEFPSSQRKRETENRAPLGKRILQHRIQSKKAIESLGWPKRQKNLLTDTLLFMFLVAYKKLVSCLKSMFLLLYEILGFEFNTYSLKIESSFDFTWKFWLEIMEDEK